MFDFNKRDSIKSDEFPDRSEPVTQGSASPPQGAPARRTAPGPAPEGAIIGPSIHIDGELHGEEDLVIEGEVKGAVHLRHHSLTIGGKGKVTANIYANVINVDGFMHGDLFGAERVSIRKTAQVHGNVTSPRVSLEEGAQFKGTIEMDANAEALRTAFGDRQHAPRGAAVAAMPAAAQKPATTQKPAATQATGPQPGKPDGGSVATAGRSGKPA